jgi:flagellar protein FliO/FliZ
MSFMKEAQARLFTGLFLVFLPFTVQAAESSVQATPALASPLSFSGMLQVLIGLFLVLAAVVATAWLLRRFSPGQIVAGGAIRVIGGVAVGAKERLVLVEIGETWLVLGVAPGQVNALHTMPKPADAGLPVQATQVGDNPFSAWLKQAMQGRRGG